MKYCEKCEKIQLPLHVPGACRRCSVMSRIMIPHIDRLRENGDRDNNGELQWTLLVGLLYQVNIDVGEPSGCAFCCDGYNICTCDDELYTVQMVMKILQIKKKVMDRLSIEKLMWFEARMKSKAMALRESKESHETPVVRHRDDDGW